MSARGKRGRRAGKRRAKDKTTVFERAESYRWRNARTRGPAGPVSVRHFDPKTGELL